MEHIRQVIIRQLQMQHTLGMFHFGEQLFLAVHSAKHVYYLLEVSDKIQESSRWQAHGPYRNQGWGKQETWIPNLMNIEC